MSVKVTKDTTAALLRTIQGMTGKRVLVGIPAYENDRNDDPEIGNAQLGYIHENGSPANNIPARPFLTPGVAAASDNCVAILKGAAKSSLTGDRGALDKGLNAAGLVAQASVKNYIKAGENFLPLKPGTLAARRRKGAKGTKPLIRTAQLLNSITYVVREAK